jgi:transcription antitermination factor NusG
VKLNQLLTIWFTNHIIKSSNHHITKSSHHHIITSNYFYYFRKLIYRDLEKTKSKYNWYALYTKSRAEKKVYEQLIALDIKAYLPLRRVLRQWSDRKKWVEVPVISSYIFVNITAKDYNRVFDANGVVAYVSHKGKAVSIPEHEIEIMRRTIDNKIEFDIKQGNIKKGQEITVTSGPLKGIKGIVNDVRGNKKLYLNISNIGYTLVINMEDVEV